MCSIFDRENIYFKTNLTKKVESWIEEEEEEASRMMREPNPCYPNNIGVPIYEEAISSSLEPNNSCASSPSNLNPTSFLYNLSLLKDKVHQVQSLATMFFHQPSDQSTTIAMPTMTTLIQEIIVTASSMMFSCQQTMSSLPPPSTNDMVDQWYHEELTNYNNNNSNNNSNNITTTSSTSGGTRPNVVVRGYEGNFATPKTEIGYDIVELEAADLLAKYTHYCAVCGKGFKRDANLRMHMRAHGDQYKSTAALTNPIKAESNADESARARIKYSCPQEGCRWNKRHAKFQPLKSMICVKNHYKRSHCPKMYVCKRCNRKEFSVLSDLRTHEKHCGDLKWMCSCGTTFSRKDKLMGHVALFVGHAPVVSAASGSRNTIEN